MLKQVILSITFYRYIFLAYHLVLLILIVIYDALDINSIWFIRPTKLYKKTYKVEDMNKNEAISSALIKGAARRC